jgi:ELWxxDGT repeat protein
MLNHGKNLRQSSRRYAFVCETLEGRTLLSSAILLKDINTGTLGNVVTPLARIGTTTFLAANDGVHGQELYTTNGTAAGTSMVTDLYPGITDGFITGSSGPYAAVLNNNLYFISSEDGRSLYKSDGTAAGTQYVKQIYNFYGGEGDNFQVAGSKLFFNFSYSTTTMWVSDGTNAGTVPLSQAVPALSSYTIDASTVANNKLFLIAHDSSNIEYLYVTDGTAAGTTLLKSGISNYGLFVAGSRVLFEVPSANLDIWSSDGTVPGTALISSNKRIDQYAPNPTKSYFIGYDYSASSESLFTTTGTSVTLVKSGFGFTRPGMGILPNGDALFVTEVSSNMELFRSDGTSTGTIELHALNSANDQTFVVTDVGSVGVFSAYDATDGTILWKSDGSVAGTTPLPINNYSQASPTSFLGDGSPVYFAANDGVHGNELWKTDGTTAGTALVEDIDQQPASSNPSGFTLINGKVWFSATSTAGTQPWVTDGTAAGTTAINTNASSVVQPRGYVGLGSKVFFGSINELLYVYNGSTVSVVQNASAQPASVGGYAVFNNAIYLAGSPGGNYYLWKTDGTAAGTTQISTTQTIEGFDSFVVSGSTMYFVGTTGGNDELYAINSSNQITQLSTFTGLYNPLYRSVVMNGKLYFVVDNAGGLQLWQSNGTAVGTTLVKQVTSSEVSSSGAIELTVTNNTLYMATIDPSSTLNTEIFKSDGTAAGTTLVTDLTGVQQGYSDAFVGVNGHLFFTATSAGSGGGTAETPWYSDGTAANTYNLMPGLAVNPHVQTVAAFGNTLYFIALDLTHGNELWKSDGTVGGTALALDINPGPGDGFDQHLINYLTQIGGTLYLNAIDGVHGSEPMVVYDQDTISGAASGDSITLTQDADHANIDWSTTSGPSGKVPITDPAGLTIESGTASDTINLNNANGNPLPNLVGLVGAFTLNGLTGSNPLANTNIDIERSTVFITYPNAASDPLAVIRGYLKNGYNGGLWNGTATSATGVIRSEAATLNPNQTTAIGYADSAAGLVSLPANTIELKYTLYGDTGLTGTVGFTDFMRMTQHYTLNSGATWGQGDFNYDGSVNSTDFALLKPNYGQTLPAPAMLPIVAEPVTAIRPPRVTVPPPASAFVSTQTAPPAVVPATVALSTIVTDDLGKSKNHARANHRRKK